MSHTIDRCNTTPTGWCTRIIPATRASLPFWLLGLALVLACLYGAGPVWALSLEEVRFYHRMDADARYHSLRAQWQSKNMAPFTAKEAEDIAWQAFLQSSLEKPVTRWQAQGGLSPGVMVAKVYLRNDSAAAQIEIPLQVTLSGHVGPLRVDPTLLLTDTAYLSQQARWRTLYTGKVVVPAMAPGEEMLFPVTRFEMYRFLRFNPNVWPEKLKIRVSAPGLAPVETVLDVEPDHFVMPEAYRY